MDTTDPWNLPYPEPGDHTRTWEYWQALADATNAALTQLKTDTGKAIPQIQNGAVNIAATTQSNVTATVTFPKVFGSVPAMVTNLRGSPSGSLGFSSRAFAYSASGATVGVFAAAAGTFVSTPLDWLAYISAAVPLPTVLETPPPPDGWHSATATCHTPECPKNGETIPDIYVPAGSADEGWQGITCGACRQSIEDVA